MDLASPIMVDDALAGGLVEAAPPRASTPYSDALRESETRFRDLIDQASDGIFIADLEGRYTEVNAAACAMLGYTREELLGKTIVDLIPEADVERLWDARKELLVPGAVQIAEWTLVHKDGTPVPVEVSAKILRDGRWQAFVRDIRDRKRAEEATARSLRELEMVLESIPDPVAIRVGDRYAWVNSAAARVGSYSTEELIGRQVLDMVHPDDRKHVVSRMERVSRLDPLVESDEVRFLAKDGSAVPLELRPPVPVSYRGQAAHFLVAHDTRAVRQLQTTLASRERLATVGTLAAGVGHEINNPLVYVITNLDIAAEEIAEIAGPSPSTRIRSVLGLLREARDGAERIRKIVRGLKTFATADQEERREVGLWTALEVSLNLASNELRRTVQVVKNFRPVPPVLADESRLVQVFINLLVNAAQAMSDRPVEDNVLTLSTWTDDDGHAVVEVRDNGPGMTEDVASKVFEPFFTTKAVGRGTGLGLSISYGIITALGGRIACETAPGAGTSFRVVLPPFVSPESMEPIAPAGPSASTRGRILVVDDEPMVATIIARLLSDEHDVETVGSGLEAVERFSKGERFDVVLCDIMMPDVTGQELYERLAAIHPEIAARFVFVTGGATTQAIQHFLEAEPKEFLEKPFDPNQLRAVVRRRVQQRPPLKPVA